ncbi:RrF2 family transcriptional regulator [Saccharicrinis sp. FJH54]|uniref:RrF2 family transcriptional regulator n=1 Tax=Saccharicrinis sp. FJH54 TaxID=3344665 RepID=UPI0035D44CDA
MKFSTKTRYGLRAMMEIANADQKTGIFQKDIAANQDISLKYLDHIIHALKVANLITNVRGKKSGYILTKAPSRITVFDIHSAFEPGICVIDCLSRNIKCEREGICAAKGFWGGLNNHIVTYFKSITLKSLLADQLNMDDDSATACC